LPHSPNLLTNTRWHSAKLAVSPVRLRMSWKSMTHEVRVPSISSAIPSYSSCFFCLVAAEGVAAAAALKRLGRAERVQ
jgi:hypothetical protein